ncbi:hypothetical protein D9Q98_010009 [Chlorella vulgaris]|uniref:ODAD1 central coiled coil region domain-containing protein n=1 Tax=Chlorella vulgaris TaxID=3077 RepID=A0A9D4TFX1_CHLVU|nr:hypothetical protein D9Q98_010009 [Chlorella vulgaris]
MPIAAAAPGAVLARSDNAQFLRKQRAAIEVIAADNVKLKEEFMLENKFSVNPTTQTAAALIANLQEQADVYVVKIKEEQRLKAELEQEVGRMKQHIIDQRVQMGGITNSADQAVKVQRRIRILEDRLQQASVRYNDALTRSRALRARIDGLRRERLLFEELHGKLQRGLARKKAEIVDVISNIAESHEAREKALILQIQVKAQADKDVASYEAEWAQLTNIVEQDRRSREAQRQRDIAVREGQMAELFSLECTPASKRRAAAPGRAPPTGEVAAAATAAAAVVGSTGAAASAPERIRELKAALSKVLEATGVSDADELLAALVEGEEANFSLFSYVNELSGEVDKTEAHIAELRKEVARCRSEAAAAANDGRAQALRAMAAELAAVEAAAEGYEGKHGQAVAAIHSLQAAVLDMFNRCGCATPEVLELVGEEGVSEKSLMQYLGVLEQRTNELLAQYGLLATDGSDAAAGERTAAVLTGKMATAAPLQYVIEAPSTGSGAGGAGPGGLLGTRAGGRNFGSGPTAAATGGGDDERPLSRGSLAARVRQVVALKVDSARTSRGPFEFGRICQLVALLYALLATLALWTLVRAPSGIQHLLLLSLLRLSVLLSASVVAYRSHRRSSSEDPSPFAAASLAAAPQRTTLAQAALYLQLSWLASELVLGAGLLLFYPRFSGSLAVDGTTVSAASSGTLLTLLPLLCAVVMSGCFLFLQRLSRRCRQQHSAGTNSPRLALECGSGTAYSAMPARQRQPSSHQMNAHSHSASLDVICSPISEDGSFSSCTSTGTSAAFYSRSSSSSVLGLNTAGSCGVPSPTGHVRSIGGGAQIDHEAAISAACQILLVEHHVASLVDTNDSVMFVHKKLRPIKTRPEGGPATPAAPPAARAH